MSTTLDRQEHVLNALHVGHARVQERLTELADGLLAAVACRDVHAPYQRDMVSYLRGTVLPHVEAETALVRSAVDLHGEAYTRAVSDEHRLLVALVDELDVCRAGVDAAALAGAIVVLCENRIRQEDEYLLPTLADHVDLSQLLIGSFAD